MLTTLKQAKAFLLEKIPEYQGETLTDIEKDILGTLLETTFFAKIEGLVDEQEIAEKKLESEESVESYLFHKIPNYTTLLEETTAEILADYLSNEQ